MTKFIFLLSVSGFLFTANISSGQQPRRCGTMEYLERQKAADPSIESNMKAIEEMTQKFENQPAGLRTSNTVITIPVVFHILYHNTFQNISTNRIYDQINTMNKDYAYQNADTTNTPAAFRPLAGNTNIQFCLAQQDTSGNYTTGIIRKSVAATGYDPLSNDSVKFSALGGDDAWDRNNYLNIWVCNFKDSSLAIIGVSQFPGGNAQTDGCVLLYTTVGGANYHGTDPFYNLGRTACHEVGHWLNLRHIWGDDGGTCNGSDFVTDTPNQADENFGCPAFPHISCSNGPNGDMYMNYMDYTNDNCLNMFTLGQGNRMNAVLNGPRASIKNSTKCVDLTVITDPSKPVPFTIYPNPSAGEFILTSDLNDASDIHVSITNMLGEIVFQTSQKNVQNLVQKIDLGRQSNGIYMVEIRTRNGVSTEKLVLNR